jgi:hypothetical protein
VCRSSDPPYWSAEDPPATTIPFYSWHNEDSPSLYAPRSLLRPYSTAFRTQYAWKTTGCTVIADDAGNTFNQVQVASFAPKLPSAKCAVELRSIDLSSPSAAPVRGKPVYVMMQAQIDEPRSRLALSIEPGVMANGSAIGAQTSSDFTTGPLTAPGVVTGEWQAVSFHGTLGVAGEARFGFSVTGGRVSVAGVVAAPIGQEWSRLLLRG